MSQQFFDGIDTIGLVEEHVKQALALQDTETEKMVKIYRQARTELRDRLDHINAKTFQAQHLRVVLAQVDGALRAMQLHMKGAMNDAAMKAALQGAGHIVKEVQAFSKLFEKEHDRPDLGQAETPIDMNQVQIATDTQTLLVRRYETSLQTYSEQIRQGITQELTRAAIQEESYGDVVLNLSRFFRGEEWKAARLARTELHGVYNLSKMNGMKELKQSTFPDLKKALIHPMDDRTGQDSVELAIENPIVDIHEPFIQTYKSSPKAKAVKYVFMVPPDRPNDRAVVVPFREEWR